MANTFIVPFNYQPVNTGRGTDANSYSPSTGKYARVIVTMTASAWSSADDNVGAGIYNGSSNTNTVTVEFYLTSSETLDFTKSAASSTGANASPSFVQDTSTITVDIGGNPVAICEATAHNYLRDSSNTTVTANVSGSVSAYFRYEEYNEIS